MKKFKEQLLAGVVVNDKERGRFRVYDKITSKTLHYINYDSLIASDFGYVYEKYVGQYFEQKGFSVEYCGIINGFLDGGIDLIARSSEIDYFIQCKYLNKSKLSKQKIERLLYKAGNRIHKLGCKWNDVFLLVVPNKDNAFHKSKYIKGVGKMDYPLYNYFLSMNNSQERIKVDILFLPM